MSVELSSVDLARVAACSVVLVAPIASDREEDWCTTAAGALRDLVGADTASLMLPAEKVGEVHTADVDARAVAAYMEHFHELDVGYNVRRRALGAEVWSTSMLWDPEELQRSEYWNDYKVPYRLYDALGICIRTDHLGGEAGVFLHRGDETSRFHDRELRLLQLSLPAFSAGVRSFLRFARRRDGLADFLDRLSEGLLVADARGEVLHMNASLRRVLAQDEDAQVLTLALRRAAQTAAELARHRGDGRRLRADAAAAVARIPEVAPTTVTTRRGRYRVSGTAVGDAVFGERAAAVAILERLTRPSLTREALRHRYRLTERELDVAYLLAAGRSNGQIVDELGISVHTAERHTEHVLMKLGLHSRTLVADAIRAD